METICSNLAIEANDVVKRLRESKFQSSVILAPGAAVTTTSLKPAWLSTAALAAIGPSHHDSARVRCCIFTAKMGWGAKTVPPVTSISDAPVSAPPSALAECPDKPPRGSRAVAAVVAFETELACENEFGSSRTSETLTDRFSKLPVEAVGGSGTAKATQLKRYAIKPKPDLRGQSNLFILGIITGIPPRLHKKVAAKFEPDFLPAFTELLVVCRRLMASGDMNRDYGNCFRRKITGLRD